MRLCFSVQQMLNTRARLLKIDAYRKMGLKRPIPHAALLTMDKKDLIDIATIMCVHVPSDHQTFTAEAVAKAITASSHNISQEYVEFMFSPLVNELKLELPLIYDESTESSNWDEQNPTISNSLK